MIWWVLQDWHFSVEKKLTAGYTDDSSSADNMEHYGPSYFLGSGLLIIARFIIPTSIKYIFKSQVAFLCSYLLCIKSCSLTRCWDTYLVLTEASRAPSSTLLDQISCKGWTTQQAFEIRLGRRAFFWDPPFLIRSIIQWNSVHDYLGSS